MNTYWVNVARPALAACDPKTLGECGLMLGLRRRSQRLRPVLAAGVVRLPENTDPGDLPAERIRTLIHVAREQGVELQGEAAAAGAAPAGTHK